MTVGVFVSVWVGRIRPVELGSGVDEGNGVGVKMTSSTVNVQVGGNCSKVGVAVGGRNTSGSGGGGNGFNPV